MVQVTSPSGLGPCEVKPVSLSCPEPEWVLRLRAAEDLGKPFCGRWLLESPVDSAGGQWLRGGEQATQEEVGA